MDTLWIAYILSAGFLAAAGLAMVGAAVRAYFETEREEMIYLSIGFSVVVASVLATTIVGITREFQNPRFLFTVQYTVMTVGFLFILYSIWGE